MSNYNGNNNGGFQPPARKKNALDHDKLKLRAPTPDQPGKYANMVWGFYANNPRLTVYTGDPDDASKENNYGKIVAALDTLTFYAFIEAMKTAIASESEWKMKVIVKNYTWYGGKRSEVPVPICDLWVGKDKEGCIFISVTAERRPKIKFIIGPTEFLTWIHGDGTPATKGEVSVLYAKGYVNIFSMVYANLAVSHYEEKEIKDKPNQGGNNYNRNNNQGNNQNQNQNFGRNLPTQQQGAAAPTVEEDLPF